MRLRALTILLFCSLITSSFVVIFFNERCEASGDTIWVDDDVIYCEESDGSLDKPFCYIQSAINAADDGDTIVVLSGTYGGDLTIDKSVTITVQDKLNTIITSDSKNAYIIDITADSVSLEGFTIHDTTTTSHRKVVIHVAADTNNVVISGNIIEHSVNGYGIYLDGTYNAVIENNIVNDTNGVKIENSDANSIHGNNVGNCTGYPALRLVSSNANHIEDNVFRNSTNGIYAQGSDGIIIKNNTMFENDNNGITISGGSDNIIENNNINNNNRGINLISSSQSNIIENSIYSNSIGVSFDASGCTIRGNSISGSGTYGVYAEPGSSSNTIFNNTFHNLNIGTYHAREQGNNQWDNGSLGNYWSDYYGPDNDDDGIGEVPYTLGGVCDNYPKGIFQQPPVVSDPIPTHLETDVDKHTTLSVKVVDPEGERMDIYFYYVLDNEPNLIDVVYDVESGGRAAVPFSSTVQGENAVYTYIGLGYGYIGVWYVVVKDQYSENDSRVSEAGEWIFSTLNVPVDNKRPIADAGGPYEGQIGDQIQFDGSGCNDTDGTIEFYRWSFGDGESVINVKSPVHIYQSAGTWEVFLVIIDNNGSSSTASTDVTIGVYGNHPPDAEANGPYTGNVGDLIHFSSSGSDDPDGDDLEFFWDFGDGTNSTEQNPAHTYNTTGTYTVKLNVTDSKGLTDSDSTYVIIEKKSSPNGGLPGYELILVIIAILFVFILRRKKKKLG